MIKTVRYTAGEIGRLRVIEDFLPPPDKLVSCEAHVKAMRVITHRDVHAGDASFDQGVDGRDKPGHDGE